MLESLDGVAGLAERDQRAARLECRQRPLDRLGCLTHRRAEMQARFRITRCGLGAAEFQHDMCALAPRGGLLERPPQIEHRLGGRRPTERHRGRHAERVDSPGVAGTTCFEKVARDALRPGILSSEPPGSIQVVRSARAGGLSAPNRRADRRLRERDAVLGREDVHLDEPVEDRPGHAGFDIRQGD